MIARYQMKTKEALKGGAIFSLIHLPRTLLGLFLMALPYILSWYYLRWALGLWILCTGVALYYNSRMFVKVFKPLEEKTKEEAIEEETKKEEAKEKKETKESETRKEGTKKEAIEEETKEVETLSEKEAGHVWAS